MQATEIRELNDREIEERIAELREERFRLRLRAATQPLEQPHRLRDLRKDIARLKTVLTERRVSGSGAKGQGSAESQPSESKRGAKAKRDTGKQAKARRER
jgi:large subunit ribosomal protein L29